MPSFSKNEVILVRYAFSDLSAAKIRPAVIVGVLDRSPDIMIVPLTSKTSRLATGEFAMSDWGHRRLERTDCCEAWRLHGSYTSDSKVGWPPIGSGRCPGREVASTVA